MLATRFRSQLLTGEPAGTVTEAVGHLLAVQAQDSRAFRLALRPRTTGLAARDVDCGLETGSILVSWLNRGTLHLVRAEDYWWLHAVTAGSLGSAMDRRLRKAGLLPSQTRRAVDVIVEQVNESPKSRADLRGALQAAGVPTAGQLLIYLIAKAAAEEHVVRGPVRGGEQCFVDARAWLTTEPEGVEREALLARLAERYLAAHGSAEAADLAVWAGISLTAARTALRNVARESEPEGDVPEPRLLGGFDPLLHGWASRRWIVGEHGSLVTTNGIFRPFALVDGRAVGTWRLSGNRIVLHPLEPVRAATLRALDEEAAAVLRYLGRPVRPIEID